MAGVGLGTEISEYGARGEFETCSDTRHRATKVVESSEMSVDLLDAELQHTEE